MKKQPKFEVGEYVKTKAGTVLIISRVCISNRTTTTGRNIIYYEVVHEDGKPSKYWYYENQLERISKK